MTHTVTRSDQYAPIHGTLPLRAEKDVPEVGALWAQPVLTVIDRYSDERTASILFNNDSIVINPWESGRSVHIAGEDLFALRELLAEMDEEAFVRPADPVEKVEKPAPWQDGDIVIYEGANITTVYTRVNDHWAGVRTRGFGRSVVRSHLLSDAQIDGRLEDPHDFVRVLRRGGVNL